MTGDDDGDGPDNNDPTTTMATAHQAGYYAHFILNWKKGGVLKYLRFSKILFHGQKRKKIYSPTHPFLMIKNCRA